MKRLFISFAVAATAIVFAVGPVSAASNANVVAQAQSRCVKPGA